MFMDKNLRIDYTNFSKIKMAVRPLLRLFISTQKKDTIYLKKMLMKNYFHTFMFEYTYLIINQKIK